MTNPTTPATVPVTQADREAAARYERLTCPAVAEVIVSGDADTMQLVQAIARHRLAAEKEALERAAKVAERARYSDDCYGIEYQYACHDIATAIRALIS